MNKSGRSPGRPKGVPNKMTMAAKEAVQYAADNLGGGYRLLEWAQESPFNGQVFFHPNQGTLGSLQRRLLYGPRFINLDFSGEKQTKITERLMLTLRMEALNSTNTPSFFFGDQLIDSVNFGRITGTQSGRRVVQFSVSLRF